MKNFLAMAIFALGIVLMQFAQVEAREVLATSETRGGKTIDHYIIAESLQSANFGGGENDFKFRVHSIGRNFSENKYWEVGFTHRSDGLYVVLLPSSYIRKIDGDEVFNMLFLTAVTIQNGY